MRFDQLTTRLLQIAELEAKLRSDGLLSTVRSIGRQCELAAAFTLLRTLRKVLFQQDRLPLFTDVILALSSGHGFEPISALNQALTLYDRLAALNRVRGAIVDEATRLFLALLLTQQVRSFVVAHVASNLNLVDPSEHLATCICELGSRNILNVPSDETTRRLLAVWLREGREAVVARVAAHDAHAADDLTRRLQEEPLLAPLLKT